MSETTEAAAGEDHGSRSVGTVRIGDRERSFSKHFAPGDIAVIDVADLDRKFASELMLLQPSVVLNASQSTTGRRPSLGAQELVLAGVILVDDLGADLSNLQDGDEVTVIDGDVFRGDSLVASGTKRTPEDVGTARSEGRKRLGTQVRAHATASPEHFARDEALILDGVGLPDLGFELRGRTAMVISAVPEGVSVAQLKQLATDQNVVLIAVGAAGIQTLKAMDRIPEITVGDVGTSGAFQARQARANVLLERPDGKIPGSDYLREQSVDYHTVPTSLDEFEVALLLAANNGAELVIEASPLANLETLVDAGGSSFNGVLFVRAQLAGLLISARAALRLDRPGINGWLLALMVLVAILVLGAAILFTPWGSSLWQNTEAAMGGGLPFASGSAGVSCTETMRF